MSDFLDESFRILGGDGRKSKSGKGGKPGMRPKSGGSGPQGPKNTTPRPQKGSTTRTHGNKPKHGQYYQ